MMGWSQVDFVQTASSWIYSQRYSEPEEVFGLEAKNGVGREPRRALGECDPQ